MVVWSTGMRKKEPSPLRRASHSSLDACGEGEGQGGAVGGGVNWQRTLGGVADSRVTVRKVVVCSCASMSPVSRAAIFFRLVPRRY